MRHSHGVIFICNPFLRGITDYDKPLPHKHSHLQGQEYGEVVTYVVDSGWPGMVGGVCLLAAPCILASRATCSGKDIKCFFLEDHAFFLWGPPFTGNTMPSSRMRMFGCMKVEGTTGCFVHKQKMLQFKWYFFACKCHFVVVHPTGLRTFPRLYLK